MYWSFSDNKITHIIPVKSRPDGPWPLAVPAESKIPAKTNSGETLEFAISLTVIGRGNSPKESLQSSVSHFFPD